MMKYAKAIPAFLILLGACAAEPIERTAMAEPTEPETCPGHVDAGDEPREPAAIPNIATFDRIVAEGGAPFDQLSAEELGKFRSGMTESEKGISTIRYDVLQRALSPEDYAHAMSLFGIDLAEDDHAACIVDDQPSVTTEAGAVSRVSGHVQAFAHEPPLTPHEMLFLHRLLPLRDDVLDRLRQRGITFAEAEAVADSGDEEAARRLLGWNQEELSELQERLRDATATVAPAPYSPSAPWESDTTWSAMFPWEVGEELERPSSGCGRNFGRCALVAGATGGRIGMATPAIGLIVMGLGGWYCACTHCVGRFTNYVCLG